MGTNYLYMRGSLIDPSRILRDASRTKVRPKVNVITHRIAAKLRPTGQQGELGHEHSADSSQAREEGRAGRARDSWDTPDIVELGNFTFSIKVGESVTLYDRTTVSELFPKFAAAASKFTRELELEPDGFIITVVHSLVWPTPQHKRHHVYTQISGQAGYVERTKYPRYLRDEIRSTWHSPGEEFLDRESDAATEIIELSSDSDPDYDP